MEVADVTPLNRYEKRDLQEDLNHRFIDILKTQNKLSGIQNKVNENVNNASDSVREYISGRIPTAVAMEIGILTGIIAFFSCVPALLFSQKFNTSSGIAGILGCVFIFLMLILTEIIILKLQEGRMKKKIDAYNESMEDNLGVLTQDLRLFSNFVSDMVSYSRGSSFLRILEKKRFKLEKNDDQYRLHIKAINALTDKMEKWFTAFFLETAYSADHSTDFKLNIDINPKENSIYTFEFGKEYEVSVNETGDTINSPFSFISRLWIEREERFENA